jgi:hypothetical protein
MNSDSDNIFVGDNDHVGLPDPLDYRLRCAIKEIEQLRAERDEARRDVCNMMHITGFLAGDYAVSRGWDCFPDRKRNVSDEVKNFRTIIERDYNAVVAQRDEARREAMLLLSERSSEKEMREEYRKRGWSYLKKENNND